jgi:hypothetical protein
MTTMGKYCKAYPITRFRDIKDGLRRGKMLERRREQQTGGGDGS